MSMCQRACKGLSGATMHSLTICLFGQGGHLQSTRMLKWLQLLPLRNYLICCFSSSLQYVIGVRKCQSFWLHLHVLLASVQWMVECGSIKRTPMMYFIFNFKQTALSKFPPLESIPEKLKSTFPLNCACEQLREWFHPLSANGDAG